MCAFQSLSPEKSALESGSICRPQCEEIKYECETSFTKWPSNTFWMQIAERYNISYANMIISEADVLNALSSDTNSTEEERAQMQAVLEKIKDHISQNFLRLNIYYRSKSTTQVLESPKYDTQGTLSSLGGAFSLYLGVSFISLFELGELFFRSILSCINVSFK